MSCLTTSKDTYLPWNPGAQPLDSAKQFSCSHVFSLLHDEMLAIISCSEHHSSVGAEFENMEHVIGYRGGGEKLGKLDDLQQSNILLLL